LKGLKIENIRSNINNNNANYEAKIIVLMTFYQKLVAPMQVVIYP